MRKINSRKGFTLMEIIVVMIILGIVAAVAAPNVFNQINRNRGQEALANMSPIRQALDACLSTNAAANCAAPVLTATTNFGYTVTGIGATVVALGNCPAGTSVTVVGTYSRAGFVAADTLAFCRTAANTWSCVGGGIFTGACQ